MKRHMRSLLCLLLCFLLFPAVHAAAAEPEVSSAERLKYTLKGISGQSRVLNDWKQDTGISVRGGTSFTIKAKKPIACLYILWDAKPRTWTLKAGGEKIVCGKSKFRHEYIELPHPAKTVTITLSKGSSIRINEIYAFTEGALPDWVQVWEPPAKYADILVIPTHADDEYVFFGGILPTYAGERGLDVQVLYMTDHQKTQKVRNHELLNGLWLSGVRRYPIINGSKDLYLTGRKEARRVYETRFLRAQVRAIRRCRPLVIVGHDVKGEYGHQAHIQNALCLQKAVTLAADPSFDPESAEKYGVWETPKLYLHLYGRKSDQTVLNYSSPLKAFGGKTAFEVAKEAFACHKSQQVYSFEVYGAGDPYDSRRFGLYRSLVGPDEDKNDLMEHIVPENWR